MDAMKTFSWNNVIIQLTECVIGSLWRTVDVVERLRVDYAVDLTTDDLTEKPLKILNKDIPI